MAEERPADFPKLDNYTPSRFMLPTSHYDKSKADRAVAFIENLRHTKGKWAGKRFWLLPWQEQIVRDIFGIIKEDGTRQFHTAYVEIGKKNGKQLALDTPIPTPNGFTPMGELRVGDTVFDENGNPCRVVAKSEIDDTEQAYKLTFKDGDSIVAGERHLWNVEYIIGKAVPKLMTTGEIYKLWEKYRVKGMCKKKYINRSPIRIPVTAPLKIEDINLPVDPYLYGYWLGNGNATKPEITVRTCDTDELISYIPYKLHNRYTQKCGGSEILVYTELKRILVKSFRDKVIAPEYLRSGTKQRWELLQGLMDSDGCISTSKSQSIYVSTIEPLAKSVSELLWSLGIKNAMTTTPSTRCGKPTGETLYIIRFTTFEDQPTSKLQRKICRKRERVRPTRSCFHYLKNVELVSEKVKMQCIQVDSPSHQYLAGLSMIPTHNSELAAAVALYLLYADNEPSAEVYGAAADRQQASIVFDVANKMVDMCPALLRRSKIMAATKRVVNYSNSGFYQVLSAEVGCMTGDTVVQMADGSIKSADSVKAGDIILSYDGLTPIFDEVVSVKKEEPSEVLAITTHHGRRTKVTANHPFWKMYPGRRKQDLTHQYEWVEAETLRIDDRLATALGWPRTYNAESNISVQEAWALGAWAGDGDCTRFRFINPDESVIEKMRDFICGLGSDLKSMYSTRQKQEGKDKYQNPIEHHIIGVGKRRKSPGREWIRDNFAQASKAHTKEIPKRILTGSPDTWAAFLAGYIDTDGCVTDHGVRICSVSDKLLKQCQILFARLGINASLAQTLNVTVNGKPQIRKLWKLVEPYMAHIEKRQRIEKIAGEEIYCLQRSSESDKVTEIKNIGEQATYSFEMKHYQTHSTDGLVTHNTKHGLNVSGLVFDELHAQPNRKLYDVLTKGSGDAREQPLFFIITTAGTDKNSICYELHTKAVDILNGRKIDATFYPVVYGLDVDDDWHDERNWYKANPSLGYTIKIDRVREAYKEALQNPAEENVFRQLRMNTWVNSAICWIPEDVYDKGNIPIDTDALVGRECYGGLDLSSTSDITAFVLIFPPRTDDEPYILLPYFWLPEETLDLRVRRDHVPYDVWHRQGYFNVTEGNVIHYAFIEKFIENLGKKYNIREIGVDRWNATQITQNLEDAGFIMVPIGMGFKDMSPPTKEFYKLLLEGKIAHGGNPILKWMAQNVVVETDAAENIKPTKAKSTEKIDGIVAAIMALDRCVRNQNAQQGSVYDTRGIIIF